MWQVAFSSNSVSRKRIPALFTREAPSTSATSPSERAPSSASSCSRTTSAPCDALRSTTRPPSKRSSRSRTRVPWSMNSFVARTVPSARRRSGVVKTSSVGMLGTCGRPNDVSMRAHRPARARQQPELEVGAGPVEADAVEATLGRAPRAPLQLRHVRLPGRDGVGLVQADGLRHCPPQPLDVRLAEDRLRPALGREGNDRPVEQVLHHRLDVCGLQLARNSTRDAALVEVLEEVGRRVAADLDDYTVPLADRLDALDLPRRRPAEPLVGAVLDLRPLHPLVGVVDLHVAGARAVGLRYDEPHELGLRDVGEDEDVLPLAHVRARAHGEARVVGQLALVHGAQPYRDEGIGMRPNRTRAGRSRVHAAD